MSNTSVIPHLFRTEYCKMCAVLYRSFGIEHFEIVEDLVSDAFLKASEVWKTKGVPENPVAWLYTVARNNARDHFRKSNLFKSTINDDLRRNNYEGEDFELDLSEKNIHDSQLAMIFVACHPCNTQKHKLLWRSICCVVLEQMKLQVHF
ncbi:MAG TPA: sigma factor [Saprospiraceae bacterium]|nr:sigma factor [Saprospiraceae bacterium]